MAYEPVTARLDRRARTVLLCVITLAVAIPALFALAMASSWHHHIRGRLPAALEPGYLYHGDGGSPLGLVRFSIGRKPARAIGAEGKAFLDRETGAQWQPTPLPIETFKWSADCLGFWCSRSEVATEATRWVSRPGSFVLRSAEPGNESVIVVNPAERAVIFGYYAD